MNDVVRNFSVDVRSMVYGTFFFFLCRRNTDTRPRLGREHGSAVVVSFFSGDWMVDHTVASCLQ